MATSFRTQIEQLAEAWLKAGRGYENDSSGRVVLRHGQVLRDALIATLDETWQPIESYDKATCPLDVLVATEHGVGEASQHDNGAYGAWFWANTCDDCAPGPGQIFPTHWMRMPDGPGRRGERGK